MKTLFVGIAGLNTPATGDMLGMKAFLLGECAKRLDSGTLFVTYNDPDLLKKIEAAAEAYDQIVLVGHSFGGGAIMWLSLHLTRVVVLALLLDPAPEGDHFHQFFPWQIADILESARWSMGWAVRKALVFYQHNMQLFGVGVCGVPIVEKPGQQRNIDVTAWGLTHNDMVSDIRVLAVMTYAIQQAVPQ